MQKRRPLPSILEGGKIPKFAVWFGGKYIVLSAIARQQGLTTPYVSMIINGKRLGRIPTLRKICASIDMSLEEFLTAIEERKALLKVQDDMRGVVVKQYLARVKKEDASGLPVMPGLRVQDKD